MFKADITFHLLVLGMEHVDDALTLSLDELELLEVHFVPFCPFSRRKTSLKEYRLPFLLDSRQSNRVRY